MTEAKFRKLEDEAKAAKKESGVSVIYTHDLEELLRLSRWALEHGKPRVDEAKHFCVIGCVEGAEEFSDRLSEALARFPQPPEEKVTL